MGRVGRDLDERLKLQFMDQMSRYEVCRMRLQLKNFKTAWTTALDALVLQKLKNPLQIDTIELHTFNSVNLRSSKVRYAADQYGWLGRSRPHQEYTTLCGVFMVALQTSLTTNRQHQLIPTFSDSGIGRLLDQQRSLEDVSALDSIPTLAIVSSCPLPFQPYPTGGRTNLTKLPRPPTPQIAHGQLPMTDATETDTVLRREEIRAENWYWGRKW